VPQKYRDLVRSW